MKLEIHLAGKSHTVEFVEVSNETRISIDGHAIAADACQIAAGVYSILIDGKSFEARLEPFGSDLRIAVGENEFTARVSDLRKWKRGGGAGHSTDGHQIITAPMPGRVVRVLVKPGDAINSGQGIAVVEAMKMQNEVRSPKSGSVERVLVKEGQTVNAGDTIAVIT